MTRLSSTTVRTLLVLWCGVLSAGAVCSLAHAIDSTSDLFELSSHVRQRGLLAATYFQPGKEGEIILIDFSKKKAGDAPGGIVQRIAPHDALDEYPSISPDGKKIAFYSDRSGDREIYLATIGEVGAQRLTSSPGADEDPSWSPDGSLIAFHSARLGRGANIFVMRADGSEVKSFTARDSKNTVPRFSPDGKKLIFSTSSHWPGWDLETVDLESGEVTNLTKSFRTSCRASYDQSGKTVLYSYGSGGDIDLWTMKADGSDAKRLTSMPGKEYDGVFTADGAGVFFVGELKKGKGDFQIFYLNRSNGQVTQVTNGPGYFRYLSWNEVVE